MTEEKEDQNDKPTAYIANLSDFKPDPENLNLHTQRGQAMVTQSQQKRGYARPAFAASDGTVLGGNLSTMEVAADIGLGEGKVLVVETDGKIPIIHRRTDIESGSEEAVLLAADDNRTSEVSVGWNAEALIEKVESGIDFSGLFSDNELSEMEEEAMLSSELASSLMDGVSTPSNRNLGDAKKQIKPVLYTDEVAVFEMAIKTVGIKNRGQALIQICKEYLNAQKGQFDIQT